MTSGPFVRWTSPNPVGVWPWPLWHRPDTIDGNMLQSVLLQDDYHLADYNVRGALVVDCGAHIGTFTAMAAFHGASRVIAVEPVAENCVGFRLNTEPFADRVSLVQGALSPTSDDVPLRYGGLHLDPHGLHRHIASTAPDLEGLDMTTAPVFVPAVNLDALLESLASIYLFKMDIEGGEYRILEAVRPSNLAKIQNLIIETHPANGHTCASALRFVLDIFPGFYVTRVFGADGTTQNLWLRR